ncbi:PPC domain-containing DNA-binding protein [Caproicibacter sp.]|uniref:PPC domain-containing DNA-binding protein n=1 Tax=Caproicibacter sp. TaxID=2814884 RepID=UPI0039892DB1
MKCKKFGNTLVLRVDRGEELIQAIQSACEQENVKFGSITGLGAVDHAVVGLYRVAEHRYYSNTFDGVMELTSLVGSVTEMSGRAYLHLHANFAKADGQVVGGHLNEAVVSGTGEIIIQIIDGGLGRRADAVTGLNLFDL